MDDQLELLCLCGEKTLDGYFVCQECLEEENAWDDDFHDDMDGDHESGLASAGFGTDEDYGYYGDDGE
jgi:hypothetical protein